MDEELKKTYVINNDIFGLPQSYKGINFYPIKISESKILESFYTLLTYPKLFGATKEIMKMSYLKFMIYKEASEEGMLKIQKEFETFLSHISKTKVRLLGGRKDEYQEPSLTNVYIKVAFDDIVLDEYEFEEARQIILEQNSLSIEWVNQYHPELEQKLQKIYDKNPINLADQVFTMISIRGLPMSEVLNYTLYQFKDIFGRIIVKENYDLYQPLIVSGAVTSKSGDMKHFLYHAEKEDGRYGSILIPVGKFAGDNKDTFGKNIAER